MFPSGYAFIGMPVKHPSEAFQQHVDGFKAPPFYGQETQEKAWQFAKQKFDQNDATGLAAIHYVDADNLNAAFGTGTPKALTIGKDDLLQTLLVHYDPVENARRIEDDFTKIALIEDAAVKIGSLDYHLEDTAEAPPPAVEQTPAPTEQTNTEAAKTEETPVAPSLSGQSPKQADAIILDFIGNDAHPPLNLDGLKIGDEEPLGSAASSTETPGKALLDAPAEPEKTASDAATA
jgi:hypothetical protein